MAVDYSYNIPVYFLLEGYSDKFDNLVDLKQSFGIIFHYADVDLLSDEEIKSFFNYTFNTLNIRIDEDALEFMTEYSQGLPLTMQYIRDSVFWNLKSNISIVDAKESVIIAAENMKNNMIRKTTRRINNPLYEDILTKITSQKLTSFTLESLEDLLTERKRDNLHNFLEKTVKLNILEIDEYTNEYRFKDRIYYSYYYIKAFEKEYN